MSNNDEDDWADEREFMVSIWIHTGKIRQDRSIKWSRGEKRVAFVKVPNLGGIAAVISRLAVPVGVLRIDDFPDVLMSVEVVVQPEGSARMLASDDFSLKVLPDTVAELEAIEAAEQAKPPETD